jgi:hypothetical protein
MTQQHIVDKDTAEAMFPKLVADWNRLAPRWAPPSITHLPGPIACEWCVGEGWLLGAPDHYEAGTDAVIDCTGDNDEPTCNGLGYPSELEIVSNCQTCIDHGTPAFRDYCDGCTVHGVVTLGPPEALLWNVDINGPKPHNVVHRITPKETT